MKTVAGVFDREITANRAISSLMDDGFSRYDISLLMSNKTRDKLFSSSDDSTERLMRGGLLGAAVGGVLGALIAGLTTVGIIMFPGGALLAGGPIVAAFSGAGAGGALGGLSGVLISSGFAADEARRYEEEIKNGKVVVLVHVADSEREEAARLALSASGAVIKAA